MTAKENGRSARDDGSGSVPDDFVPLCFSYSHIPLSLRAWIGTVTVPTRLLLYPLSTPSYREQSEPCHLRHIWYDGGGGHVAELSKPDLTARLGMDGIAAVESKS